MFNPSAKITVYHTYDNKSSSEIFKANPNILNTSMTSDTATAFVNWTHQYIGLTDCDTEYSKIEESVSLNEIIVD